MRLSRRLSCLISEARSSSVSRSPIFVDEKGGGLHPDAGHAGHVVGGIADQRLHLDDLGRRHAEALHHLGLAEHLVLHRVVHAHAGPDELHQILVGGNDGHLGARLGRLARIGRDQIVGLVAPLLDARDIEGMHRVADQRKLGDEIVGCLRPVRLVVGVQFVAERMLGKVENGGDMRRRVELAGLAQQLPQHAAEAVHGADGQPVRRARERRQRVIGAEDVARRVDQINVVAARDRSPGGGGLGLWDCHDGRNIGIGGAAVSSAQPLSPVTLWLLGCLPNESSTGYPKGRSVTKCVGDPPASMAVL